LKRILKYVLYIFFGLIVLANILILASGKLFIYKTLIYQHADLDDYKIFQNRELKPGKAEPWNVSTRYNRVPMPDSLLKELTGLKTTAFLVIKNDSLIYENYPANDGVTTISNSFSMAKSIINILTGIALKEGKIKSLDEPVGNYLPEFKEGDKSKITLRHLLTMSSGLDWDEAYSSLLSSTTEAYYGTNLAKQMFAAPVVAPPGTICKYKTVDPQLLSMVLHKATGETISGYADEKLWTQIGTEHEALWSLDHKDGDEKAYCCFNATARDFARIGKLYLQNGSWDGKEIVPADFVALSTKPNMLTDDKGNVTDYYGYLWWMLKYKGMQVFCARGLDGQYIIVVPEKKTIIVRLGNLRSDTVINNHHKEVWDMIAAAVDIK